ncbi:hypothetical protein Glove_14g9 [Diversispora epigaea]|uniref:Uncharacterized protein n=1 Tax=Diversispora epigaea TaxID=1348612 RepID=A0A397JPX8_9GLOM|nr:hypothetical protein Glove_14g9 [Diversispora epigaea]
MTKNSTHLTTVVLFIIPYKRYKNKNFIEVFDRKTFTQMETMFYNEIETEKDKEKFQWYLKSAEGGDHGGQNNLGSYEEKAFQWYLKSAEGGDNKGQCNLGYCYQHGIGTTKDEKKAFLWYLKSAEGGNNEEKAFRRYLKSAERGNFLGQNNLGSCYHNGIGTTKDEEKAFKWYLKSAEGENHMGQNNLGDCYYYEIGTIKNEGKAFQWYLKSAEGGDNNGQCNLGYCYQYGIGTAKDEEKAFQWYLKSAEKGNSTAQFNIGYCYENGIGTIKNEEKAFKWYLKSAEENQISIEYCHRNEIRISKIKNKQNKLKHKCYNCENLNIKNYICSNCKLIEMPKWTSAEGGFGTIWKAEWIDIPEELFEFYKSNQVAFKKLKNSQEISSEFLKELIANFQC